MGLLRSQLVAPGLSVIGARAGCRYVDRVPAYLNNLFRPGMVWFSRETLNDHSVAHAKVVRRSIHLTPFGEHFCRMSLAPEEGALDPLPAHSFPAETSATTRPPVEPAPDE